MSQFVHQGTKIPDRAVGNVDVVTNRDRGAAASREPATPTVVLSFAVIPLMYLDAVALQVVSL